jgi:hypothetical protein
MAYSTAEIASIKTEYPAGTRMKWDNGRTLAVIPGVDDFVKI